MGNTPSHNLSFKLCTSSGIIFIANSEQKDHYFDICNSSPQNIKARNNEVFYNCNRIPLIDINGIENYLENIILLLPKRLLNDLGKVRIVQLMPTSDGGMPHTRPGDNESIDGIICFPNISQLYSFSTLIHELWHIHQRKYLQLWRSLFLKQGWIEWEGELPDELEYNRRYNPDTIDCPLFLFRGKWIPIPIFRDISNPKLGEVDIWFYNPGNRIWIKSIPPELLSYYSDSLPSSAYEHPRELTAYILSEPDKYKDILAFKDLIKEMGIISLPNN